MNIETSTVPNWKPTDNRFVAFLDILGFKDLIMRQEHDYIYKMLTALSNVRDTIETWGGEVTNEHKGSNIYTASFSDSIIIFSKDDTPESFKTFCMSTMWLVAKAVENSIMIKGAIAHGQISINKSSQIYFGQPIIDAYLLEEDVSYLGIVAHNSIDQFLIKYDVGVNKSLFEDFVPLKSGNIWHTNLNWFRQLTSSENNMTADEKIAMITDQIKKLRTNVSGSPRKYIDNTLKVIEQLREKHPNQFEVR
jgi:hypothetical protein